MLRFLLAVLLLFASAPSLLAVSAHPVADFNGDGRSDLLWRNGATGAVYLMPMNGAAVQPGTVIYTEANPAWQIVAIADFDGDGKADILWWNSSTGQVYLMLMNGASVKSQAMIYTEADTAWKIIGTGDFDGNGKADILWRHSTTGAVYLMPMNGTSVLPGSVVYTEPNPAWQILAIADFDGDGKDDILWWNSITGQVYQQLMNGPAIRSAAMIYSEPNTDWKIVGSGDFDGDGKADLLWRNGTTGAVYLMPMNGATVRPGTVVHTEANPAWKIVAIADFDGDGKADILWWNSNTGQVYQMLMNGSAVKSSGMIYTEGNTAWTIQAGRSLAVPPVITTQPLDQSVKVGQKATFSVMSSGTPPLIHQWWKNGTSIPGATDSSYTTPVLSDWDAGTEYAVTVGNAAGNTTSRTATLAITGSNYPPASLLAAYPFDGSGADCSGNDFTFVTDNVQYLNGSLYTNGIYMNFTAQTPNLPALDYTCITLSGNFSASKNTSWPFFQPIFTGGPAYRWLSMVLLSIDGQTSELVVFLNNQTINFHTGKIIEFDKWYHLAASIDLNVKLLRIFLDGKRILNIDLPPDFQLEVVHDNVMYDKIITLENYSNGTAFKGLMNNLQIYNRAIWTIPVIRDISQNQQPVSLGPVDITLVGANFQPGSSILVSSNPSVATISTYSVNSDSRINARITPVAPGTTTFRVANPDGGIGASGAFLVTLQPTTWTVTPGVNGGNGTISPNAPQTVANGGSVQFTAMPVSSDYGVDQWYKAGVSVQTGGTTYTDSNVSGSHPVQVSFKAKPVIQSFRVSPNLIPIGAGGVLAWTVTGASLLSVDQNIGALPSPTGTKNVAPTVTTTYTLTATNVAGSSTAMATLTVDATPFKITGFTASPTVVPFGGSSMLAWTFTGLPTNLTVNGAPVGGLTTTVSPQRRQHFTLAGSNGAGSDSLTVKVAAQGIDLVAGDINGFGAMDGQGDAARFGHMTGTAMDAAGNILVADGRNHTIRKVTPTGIVSTLAGSSGMSGFIDGPADVARFNYPSGLGFDTAGNLYVSDQGNNAVRIINPAGVVSTLAGGGFGYQDGTGRSARFASPYGLAVDRSGNVYVADSYNQVIRKITSAGAVSTLAGMPGSTGYADGTGNSATFDYPEGIAVDMVGNVFVADQMNHVVRKITPAGLVSTYAGVPGQPGSSDGAAQQARFCYPFGVAVDASGNVYVADTTNCVIRTITPAGVVSTIAGGPGNGFADGPRGVAKFMYPESLVLDLAGNAYVADSDNACLRKVTSGGIVSTLAGKAGRAGHADGTGSAATFYGPQGVAVDPKGTIYVADCGYSIIRRIDSDAHVTTFAGSPGSVGSLDGSGANARFFGPVGVVADGNGNLFIADRENHCIRKITPAGAVTTLAGKPGVSGYSDGNGSAATFCYPIGVAVDGVGNIYVADLNNSAIRKITPGGVVTTFAGTPGAWGLVDGPGGTAKFWGPSAVAVDQSGNVYVADTFNQAIRKITPGGIVSTLAGSHDQIGYIDGLGDNARFNYPMGVAVDPVGNVYVTDSSNHTIRKITPAGLVTTLAGTHGQATFIPGNLPGYLVDPIGIAITPDGDLVVSSNDGIIQITAPYQVPVISSFTANPTSIGLGQSSALSWNVSGATSLTIDNGVGAVSPVTAGSKSVSPATTTTYTLTATNLAGNVTQTVTLNVVPNPVLPVINSLTANPTSIGLGQSSALSWNVSGATSLTIDNGVGAVSPVMAGSKSVSPATTTTYTLTATNLAGNVTQTVTVNVVPNQPLTVSMGVGTTGSPSSSQSFPYGTVVNYSYSLLAGGTYLVVQVDGVTVSDSGSLTMNQAHTITASATAPPPGTIIEFKIPTAGSDPWYVSPGPDGNLWFTEYLKGIVRITPAGVTTEFPTPGVIAPFQITSGPGGNLWFIDAGDKVGRITPVGAITLFSTPTASGHPWGITSGPDGNLWFTELGNKIGRITPAGVITEFLVPTVGSSPTGITSGPEGNLWFTETAGNKIGRITPAGVITEFPIPTAGSNPIGITSGPDGNLWFTELDGNKIGRITPSGVITEFLIPTAASYTNEITAGPDGNIWFTEAAGNKIGRITPAGVITEFPIPTPDSWPWGIASGPDGNLWFTERGGDKVGRIRP